MSDSIKISPKYGLNPSISTCFFCGENKNEIVLFGKTGKDDQEAPMNVILDYEPCSTCEEKFKQGILVIGCSTSPIQENMIPIQKVDENEFLYPSGSYFVGTRDWAKRFFSQFGNEEDVLRHGKCLLMHEVVENLLKSIDL